MTYSQAFEIASDQRFHVVAEDLIIEARAFLVNERSLQHNPNSAIAFRLDRALEWFGE